MFLTLNKLFKVQFLNTIFKFQFERWRYIAGILLFKGRIVDRKILSAEQIVKAKFLRFHWFVLRNHFSDCKNAVICSIVDFYRNSIQL